VRGRVARGDDGDAHDAAVAGVAALGALFQALQDRQLAEHGGQRSRPVRTRHVQGLVGVELVEVVVALEDGFRFVVGQHAVEVEGHAQFEVVVLVGDLRGQHQAGRIVDGDRALDVFLVGAEEERGVEGRQVGVGRLAVHEGRARDVQAIVGDRAHHAQSGLRGIARKQHHLDRRLAREAFVDVQEAPDEGKGHALAEDGVEVAFLVVAVFLGAAFEVDLVRLGQVEQRARGNADDEFLFDREWHRSSFAWAGRRRS